MVERVLTVRNKLGLHARPAAVLVQTTAKFRCAVKVWKEDMEVNGKSIMGLMMLAAECGSKLKFLFDGGDEDKAAKAVEDVFARKFDEE